MAARASLAFLGQEDVILSTDPEVTYFVEQYKGHTPFTQRVDQVFFQGDVVYFGSESYAQIPRMGDIISAIYLKVNFPKDLLGTSEVQDSVGTNMIHFVELWIGSQLIERIYGEFMAMKWDLEVPQSKQGALTGLIGKGTNAPAHSYTVPIPFSILKKGLPLCAFKEPVTFRMSLHPSTLFTQNPPIIINGPINMNLDIEYTYVTKSESRWIAQNPQLRVFEQLQTQMFFVPQGVNSITCPLNFVNPVKELFIVIQNDTASGYDYSNVNGGATDQLSNLTMFFNSTDRITGDIGTPVFLRNIQALEFHTRIPNYLFYMYSFSIDPESDQPSGHVTLSRLNNHSMVINMNPSTENRYVTIYALSYNFMMFKNATADLIFKNYIS